MSGKSILLKVLGKFNSFVRWSTPTVGSSKTSSVMNSVFTLQSECQRDGLAKRIYRRVFSGDWKACSQAESLFKKMPDFLTVENRLLDNGTGHYGQVHARIETLSL